MTRRARWHPTRVRTRRRSFGPGFTWFVISLEATKRGTCPRSLMTASRIPKTATGRNPTWARPLALVLLSCDRRASGNRPADVGALRAPAIRRVLAGSDGPVDLAVPTALLRFDEVCRSVPAPQILVRRMSKLKRERRRITATERATVRTAPTPPVARLRNHSVDDRCDAGVERTERRARRAIRRRWLFACRWPGAECCWFCTFAGPAGSA